MDYKNDLGVPPEASLTLGGRAIPGFRPRDRQRRFSGPRQPAGPSYPSREERLKWARLKDKVAKDKGKTAQSGFYILFPFCRENPRG